MNRPLSVAVACWTVDGMLVPSSETTPLLSGLSNVKILALVKNL